MGILNQTSAAAAAPFAIQAPARHQAPPGVTEATAATARAVPEVRKEMFIFAPAAVQSAVMISLEDASNANDQKAAFLHQAAEAHAMASVLPPPRRDMSDPAAHFIPAPKPLVGPAPARVPLLGFDAGSNPVLEEALKSAQAEHAYRGHRSTEEATPAADPDRPV